MLIRPHHNNLLQIYRRSSNRPAEDAIQRYRLPLKIRLKASPSVQALRVLLERNQEHHVPSN